MEIIKNQFESGKLVKETRKMTKLNQLEFGKKFDRCRESIAKIENNKQEMGLSKFLEILKMSGLSFVIYKEEQ